LVSSEAWQLTKELSVKILGYDPENHQVNVEMEVPGRMLAAIGGLMTPRWYNKAT
jgi:hypothetical protein